MNILAAGHAVLACGETVLLDRLMKQEPPAEVSQAMLLERRRNPLSLGRGGCQLYYQGIFCDAHIHVRIF